MIYIDKEKLWLTQAICTGGVEKYAHSQIYARNPDSYRDANGLNPLR